MENASVTKLATLASSERARQRPIRADDEGSGCSKALAALHRAQRWNRQRYKKLATLASSEHGDGPREPTTKAAATAKHLQPCAAHSGVNDSVAKLATLASSEHGDGPREPTTKAAAAVNHCSRAPRTAVEKPAYEKLATLA